MARAKKKAGWKVNLSEVESKVLVPEGDYHVKVSEVEAVDGDRSEAGYWKWTFEIMGEAKGLNGANLYTNTSFKPQALWNLKNLLIALGADIPDDEVELDPDDYVDMECVVNVSEEMYEGRPQSKVVGYMPWEDDDKSSKKSSKKDKDDDDKKSSKKDGKKAGKGKEKEEAVEKLDADDVRNMDEDELQEVIDDHDLDADLDDFKTLKKKVNAVLDELKEKDLLEEE